MIRRALLWILVLVLLPLGMLLLLRRPLVAGACPGCFGLQRA